MELLQIIQENSRKTGNGSGISTLRAWHRSKMKLKDFVPELDRLIQEEKVVIREGINQDLLFTPNYK